MVIFHCYVSSPEGNPVFDITKINGSFGITQVLLLSGSFCIDDVPFEVLLKFRDTDAGAARW